MFFKRISTHNSIKRSSTRTMRFETLDARTLFAADIMQVGKMQELASQDTSQAPATEYASPVVSSVVASLPDDHSNLRNASATDIRFNANGAYARASVLESKSDRDVFELKLASSAQVRFDVVSQTVGLDSFLRVYDSSGKQIALNNNVGNSSNSRLTLNLRAGTYYVEASSFNSSTSGRYVFRAKLISQAPSGEQLNWSQSQRIFETDSTTNGKKEFQVTAPASRSYRMQILGLSLRSGIVQIRNSSGSLLVNRSFDNAFGANFRWDMVSGQNYSITVLGANQTNGSFSLSIV